MAIQIIREVAADVVKRSATRAVYAKQHDVNSRFLNIRIQEDGTDIKVDSTSTVILNVERPDKLENMFYGTVNNDGTVRVPMSSWMLELPGTLLCDVSIVAEGADVAKLTTMQFNIYVEEAVVADETFVETEEYSVIVDLLKRTEDAAKIASEAEASAKAAAQDASVLKEACETATINANKAADEANKVRENVEAGGYIESLKETNTGDKFSFWVGTQAEYDKLAEKVPNRLYIISDDVNEENLIKEVARLGTEVNNLWNVHVYPGATVFYSPQEPLTISSINIPTDSISKYHHILLKVKIGASNIETKEIYVPLYRKATYDTFNGSGSFYTIKADGGNVSGPFIGTIECVLKINTVGDIIKSVSMKGIYYDLGGTAGGFWLTTMNVVEIIGIC